MKRTTIAKTKIVMAAFLIFVLVPVIRPGQPVKALDEKVLTSGYGYRDADRIWIHRRIDFPET